MMIFVASVEDCECQKEFITVFQNSYNIFYAKTKEVNLVKLKFSMTNKCFNGTKIYNKQQSIEIKWIEALITGIHILN